MAQATVLTGLSIRRYVSDEELSTDFVIAADGTKSTVRRQMALASGFKHQPIPTGDAAYRLLIPRAEIEHDPVLLQMLEQNVAVRYMSLGGT
ncbi:hypothetical protein DL769_008193 [Monosporascus sp. CRB-8-3]|nr:hypothetical protein DL769_008193 [Monosporascus sp. CRB-8-3]